MDSLFQLYDSIYIHEIQLYLKEKDGNKKLNAHNQLINSFYVVKGKRFILFLSYVVARHNIDNKSWASFFGNNSFGYQKVFI